MEFEGISIVIATKGRVELLDQLLESVEIARKNYGGSTEVILVDDSSKEEQKQIDELCRRWNARREYFSPSVAGKRNYGARIAQYDVVLFLDSDCIASAHLIENHMKQYMDEKVGGVAGPLEFIGKENWFWKSVKNSPFVICFQMPYWGETSVWATTANFSIRREVFERIGGFDETFPNKPGGEDVDLGLRITKAGYTIRNTIEGLVYHDKSTWSNIRQMIKRCWYYGNADVYLVERHYDYSCDTMPRKMLMNLLGIIGIIVLALVGSQKYLFLLPIWILGDWLLTSFIIMKKGFGDNDFLHQAATLLLSTANEAGYLWCCLRKKKTKLLGRQTIFFDNQIKDVAYNGMIYTWQFVIEMLIVVGIVSIWK